MNYPFPAVISSSMLSDFKACPAKFFYNNVAEWKSKGANVHLHAGGAFAKGMEAARTAFFVNGLSADESVAMGLQALLLAYGDFECPSDSAKSAVNMAGAFEFYFDRYPLGNDGTEPVTFASGRKAIEFSFAHPLPILHPETGDPILFSGRMDAILKAFGGRFVTDEKTTSQLGASWSKQWDLRSQFTGYCWGARESGEPVNGVLVRGVSILKTRFDTLQAVSYRPDWQIDRWYTEMLSWVEDAIRMWKQNYYRHNLDESCSSYGGCPLRQICMTQPDERQPFLETYFERRHHDSLTGKDTLL
jgi:hypothetical protein